MTAPLGSTTVIRSTAAFGVCAVANTGSNPIIRKLTHARVRITFFHWRRGRTPGAN
jgi:hypothetical protein